MPGSVPELKTYLTMNAERLDLPIRITRYALILAAVAYLVLYLMIALLRIRYPFELEWMEGGSVDHVRRILAGQKLYVRPTLEFVPYIYTPLYFYVSAAVAVAVGVGFTALRLVSLVASLGCFATIFIMVRRETRDTLAGIVAAGLFAATFRIGGAWFDLARIDSLFLFLLLVGVYVLRFAGPRRSYVLAGLLVSLAFLTKQIALIMLVPLIAWSAVRGIRPRVGRDGGSEDDHRALRRSLWFTGTVVGVTGLTTVILNYLHDGWYNYYVFELASHHEIVGSKYIGFWKDDLFLKLPVAVAIAVFYLLPGAGGTRKPRDFFYPVLLAGMVGGSWISRLHLGGYENVLLPAYAAGAIGFGLGIHKASRLLLSKPVYATKVLWIVVCIISLWQFALLRYDPARQLPTGADREAGNRLVGMISKVEGQVLVPDHGYLARMAGKQDCAHRMAMHDVIRGGVAGSKADLIGEIGRALSEKQFGAVILDYEWRPNELDPYYEVRQMGYPNDEVFMPVTGKRTRPTLMCVPMVKRKTG